MKCKYGVSSRYAKTGQLKSAFLLNALQSLYLPQSACPFVSLLSACSVTQSYICVRNIMPNELNDIFIINSVAVVFVVVTAAAALF